MRTLADAFKESGDAAGAGDYAKALELLIWIHDHPDPDDPRSEMYRRAGGFMGLSVLAGVYAPAKYALTGLVAIKREQVAAGQADAATQADLRALEAALRNAGP
jgi:hypothetical protein